MKKLFSLLLALVMVGSFCMTAYADPVESYLIDTTRTGSISLYKYDLTGAEKDGVWDSSYVSTGIRDASGVEAILGDPSRVSALNANGDAYGYAVRGVEFTYVKLADIFAYTQADDNSIRSELLYGIENSELNLAFLNVLDVTANDRFAPADRTEGGKTIYYYTADVLIDGLKHALNTNGTATRNAAERFVQFAGGTAMPETDAYGHSAVDGLPLGLYLVVETRVPEMVTETTAPFLISLPMTSVVNGGEWIYDPVLYPKNMTGIPSLEKTVREAMADTGANSGSAASISDGYAHSASASGGDVIEYQIISTMPSITSEASYLTEYSFVDTISKGVAYNKGDVKLAFFKDANCTDKIAEWTESDGKFTVSYTAAEGKSVMSIAMTASGLSEINTSAVVYNGPNMVNSGYSGCTLRITYKAKLNSDSSVTYGNSGNDNKIVLTWKRSNTDYYDTLVDDCHVYVYGIDVTKQFSDGRGDFSQVKFVCHNDTDNTFLTGALNAAEGVWYVTDHVENEADATQFVPTTAGKLVIKGMEDDAYTVKEIQTDGAYTLLKQGVRVVIAKAESASACTIYGTDVLGLVQNDPRFANVPSGQFQNMPQRHLEHKLLTASATVDGNDVTMVSDSGSFSALAPFTVVNTKGFDLPQTGSRGTWMYPVIGCTMLALCVIGIVIVARKKRMDY